MPATRQANDFRNRTNRFKQLEAGRYHQTIADEGIYLLYRRGPKRSVWYVRLRDGKQRSLGLADDYQDADGENVLTYTQAMHAAVEKARRAEDAKGDVEPRGGYRVGEAAKRYIDHKTAQGMRSVTETERIIKNDILPTWRHVALKNANKRRVTEWIDGLVSAPRRDRAGKKLTKDDSRDAVRRRRATAQRKWTTLRAILNYAYDHDMVDVPVWKGVKDLRDIDPPEDSFPTVKACQRLARHASDEFRPIVEATFLTGAAYGELTALKVADYRADSGHVMVADSKRRNRAIPLTADGVSLFDELSAGKGDDELLFTRSDGRAWRKSEQIRPIRDANNAAKIDPLITLTKLRKTYGSLLLNAGVSIDVVAKAMGHSDTRITRRHYGRLLQQTIDDQVRNALPSIGRKRTVTRLK